MVRSIVIGLTVARAVPRNLAPTILAVASTPPVDTANA